MEAKKKILLVAGGIIFLVVLSTAFGSAGYFYYQYQKLAQAQPAADIPEVERLVKEIGSFLELPEDETPTLATVTDKSKLEDQSFFKKAQDGDKVLIYTQSGRAILYRPTTKKVIDVTTINIAPPETQAISSETPPVDPSQGETATTLQTEKPAEEMNMATTAPAVILYNGTTTAELSGKVEVSLKKTFADIIVTEKQNAMRSDYTETLVVDVSGTQAEWAGKIAVSLGGKVEGLPEGEKKPEEGILIILGKDQVR